MTQKTSFHSRVSSEGRGLGSHHRADKSKVQSCVEEGAQFGGLEAQHPHPHPIGCAPSPPAPSAAAGPQLACPPRQRAGGAGFPGRDGTGAWLPVLTSSGSVLRELQEREKALRLQKERLQRELEEKRKKVTGGRACGSHGLCAELWAGVAWPRWSGQEVLGLAQRRGAHCPGP